MLALTQRVGFAGRRRNSSPPGFSNTKSLSNGSFTKYMSRTQTTGTSRRKMTFSFFVKTPPDDSAAALSVFNLDEFDYVIIGHFGGSDQIVAEIADGHVVTTGFTPANSTWYHILIQLDTTQATATNRVKIFVDGVDKTDTASTYPTQNSDSDYGNNARTDYCALEYTGEAAWLLDEVARFDGQIYTAADVADGSHKPKDISGLTFGADGYWLRFETGVAATAGTDSSGNGRTFTPVNFVDGDFSATVP